MTSHLMYLIVVGRTYYWAERKPGGKGDVDENEKDGRVPMIALIDRWLWTHLALVSPMEGFLSKETCHCERL